MRIGVTFPQLESGTDAAAIRRFAIAIEQLGIDHLVAFDHVLGVDRQRPAGWTGAYDRHDMFHEPLILFAHLAAVTTRLELVCGVLVLPQRQTVLVAKQAAELDVLSRGRLRLGVSIGWNSVEFESLGASFEDRARRIEEQVEVLRRLWREDVVDFRGKWHRIDRAGINPMPFQRPIPVWMGGSASASLARAARIADGWMRGSAPAAWRSSTPLDAVRRDVLRFHQLVRESGRDERDVGIEVRINAAGGSESEWALAITQLAEIGVTHVEFNTMGAGLESLDAHLKTVALFRETLTREGFA